EEYKTSSVGNIVKNLLPPLHQIARVVLVGVVAIEGGGHETVGIVGVKLISGHLLAHETVIGLVGIQRTNNVVAVAPGGGADAVAFETVALGKAGQVQPEQSPALSELGRGQ